MLRRLIIFAVCIHLILLMQGCSVMLAHSEKSEPVYLYRIGAMETQQKVESMLGRSFFSVKQGDGSRIETYDWSYYAQRGWTTDGGRNRPDSRIFEEVLGDLATLGLLELFATPLEIGGKIYRKTGGGVERIIVNYAPNGQILNVLGDARLTPVIMLQPREYTERVPQGKDSLDIDNERIAAIIPIDATVTGIVVDDSSIWAIGCDTNNSRVFRIGRWNMEVTANIAIVGKISAIAMGEGAVWVSHVKGAEDKASSYQGFVSKIDSKTNTVISEIPVGKNPRGISVSKDAIWIANSDDGTVSRINSKTNEVFSTIRVGDKPTCIAVGEDAIWVTNYGNGTISRIDPLTNMVVANIPIGKNPASVRIGAGFIWVMSDGDVTIFRIDPLTNKVSGETISVNKKLVSMDIDGDGLHLANYEDGIVLRFDPNTLLVNYNPILIAPSKLKGSMVIKDGTAYIISSYKEYFSPSSSLQLIIPRYQKSKTLPLSKP
jgi:YVTN family beta-propeller protein